MILIGASVIIYLKKNNRFDNCLSCVPWKICCLDSNNYDGEAEQINKVFSTVYTCWTGHTVCTYVVCV